MVRVLKHNRKNVFKKTVQNEVCCFLKDEIKNHQSGEKMPIKYCIFDIGNVCYPYDPEPLNQCIREYVADKNLFDKTGGMFSFNFDELLKGKVTFSEFSQSLCGHFKISYTAEVEERLKKANHDCIGAFIPETQKLMKDLSAKGIKICLLSNITADLEDIVPQNVDKDKRFLSYELGMIKPDAKIYQHVLRQLRAVPQETLFIDDLEENISAAQALGMNGIIFERETIIQKVQQFFS